MDKRLSIYVSSPDSYSDVLAVFFKKDIGDIGVIAPMSLF